MNKPIFWLANIQRIFNSLDREEMNISYRGYGGSSSIIDIDSLFFEDFQISFKISTPSQIYFYFTDDFSLMYVDEEHKAFSHQKCPPSSQCEVVARFFYLFHVDTDFFETLWGYRVSAHQKTEWSKKRKELDSEWPIVRDVKKK